MLRRQPSWWSHNGGPLVLLAAVLLVALLAAAMRVWIGPGSSSDSGLLIGLVATREIPDCDVISEPTGQARAMSGCPSDFSAVG
ncbi:hypothetical protein C8E95_4204 [Pseudonocardia autotrophica]|uniref:Uncharacterized protein n=2 Tax=Pseudonocardia TaxID=1847 RepID=A0A1Y2N4U7_PSEAH|nr:hypothetical protein BG845_01667 [Pseudonocardia autotrophica]TDN75063.1 hypothetical protein C8E95_4204 [Pseudonocardia autotrophica]BBF99007.1 hypothetical protein Pdca_02170 [Pseudonocardia autotrophica]GEC23927.1 hypothetical protein PSA01_09560 [Pseudonocardia saturnea]